MAIEYLAAGIIRGLSSDTKPTSVQAGSIFIATDTKIISIFTGGSWSNIIFTATSQLKDGSDVIIATLADPNMTFEEGKNVITGTTTGTKIATASTQKIGFYGATPIVRPAAIADTSGVATLGLLEIEVNKLKQLLRNVGLLTP